MIEHQREHRRLLPRRRYASLLQLNYNMIVNQQSQDLHTDKEKISARCRPQ